MFIDEYGESVETNEFGAKYYYKHGDLHRESGPAIERANGTKCWYIKGKCHREDGPAIEYSNGNKWWYIKDKPYSKKDYQKALKEFKKCL